MKMAIIFASVDMASQGLIVKQVSIHIIFDSLFLLSPLLFAFLVIQYLSPFSYPKSLTNFLFYWLFQSYHYLLRTAAENLARMEVVVLKKL